MQISGLIIFVYLSFLLSFLASRNGLDSGGMYAMYWAGADRGYRCDSGATNLDK